MNKRINEMKPCPFCGSRAVIRLLSYGRYNNREASLIRFEVRCEKCNASRDGLYGEIYIRLLDTGELDAYRDDREKVIKEWNSRTDAARNGVLKNAKVILDTLNAKEKKMQSKLEVTDETFKS